MALEKPTPIRLNSDTLNELKGLSKETKVSRSALLRLAITAGLPLLQQKFGAPTPKPAAARRSKGSAAK